jgi:hypothetical protein
MCWGQDGLQWPDPVPHAPRYRQLSKDLHLMGSCAKRILPLDGGALKGILTLGYLEAISGDWGSATATILTSALAIISI